MRLDQLLGKAGFGSRNQVKKLIRSKQVRIDGRLAMRDNLIVDSGLQDIQVAGQRIEGHGSVYFLLNKPAGFVSARVDKGHETVIDLLSEKDKKPGIYPVGRLDRDTEGLLLLTNNGPLGLRMLHPQYHVSKTYYVEVNGLLDASSVQKMKEGISFHDGTKCQPADLRILSSDLEKSCAEIEIKEGKFHQVKRCFWPVASRSPISNESVLEIWSWMINWQPGLTAN